MLVSYWDAGYVKLDVTDPTNATYIADIGLRAADPQLLEQAACVKRPRATRTRPSSRRTTTTSSRPTRTSAPPASVARPTTAADIHGGDGQRHAASRVDGSITGRRGSSAARAPATRPCRRATPDDIAVVARGVVHVHREDRERRRGRRATTPCDRRQPRGLRRLRAARHERRGRHSAFVVERSAGLRASSTRPTTTTPPASPARTELLPGSRSAQSGDTSPRRRSSTAGATSTCSATTHGKLTSSTPTRSRRRTTRRSPTGFGDLSVHEVGDSPTAQRPRLLLVLLGRVPGARDRQNEKLVEVGHFIDEGGNNFWGVQVFAAGRQGVRRRQRPGLRPVHLRVHAYALARFRRGVRPKGRTPRL